MPIRMKVFSFLCALQIISEASVKWRTPMWPVFLMSVVLLFFPGNISLLLLLALAQIITCLYELPGTGNHWFFLIFINGLLLSAFFYTRYTAKPEEQSRRFEDLFSSTALLLLVAIYFFCFFHKLNSGFIDARDSCATFLLWDSVQRLTLSVQEKPTVFFGLISIYGTFVVEGLFPLLFLCRKTRFFGILLGVSFHAFLGIIHYHFSVLAFALYALLLDESYLEALIVRIRQALPSLYRFWLMTPVTLMAIYLLFFFEKSLVSMDAWKSPFSSYRPFLWLGLCAFVLYHLCKTWWEREKDVLAPLHLKKIPLVFLIFPLLAAVNALGPYLGFKNSQALTMYSNLVTEGPTSNHFIIPKGAIQIFDFGDDLVQVESSNHFAFYRMIQYQMPIPFLEVRRIVQDLTREGFNDIGLTYWRQGEKVVVSQAEKDPLLTAPLTWYERKFFYYATNRQLSQKGDNKCGW